MSQINTGGNEVKTILIKPNENKEDWKNLSTKMHRLRMELQANVRELEGKIVASNEIGVTVGNLRVELEECKLILRRKAETVDSEKALKRVEARLNNFIIQCYEREGYENENEALLAKHPWFCLSCDSELKSFNNRLPKPGPPQEKLPGRKVNP